MAGRLEEHRLLHVMPASEVLVFVYYEYELDGGQARQRRGDHGSERVHPEVQVFFGGKV
ncbi:hypothetical protein [Streptomyces sp. NBC_00687]|uniref:hypothetical protein n=1 Tax=Streptomyces sp. NBC_00687 TaxID=2975807 RepID=UPI00225478C9|nr:hypothetical protein [Streptomyces sp. NBC_00687]MCX4912022.1 hypothetical protein [Streptomyces sp. NBC_00687]